VIDITLSLWTATAKVELRISSALIAQVQAFVAELKRWTDAEGEAVFEWIAPLTARNRSPIDDCTLLDAILPCSAAEPLYRG
jgi:hypothetical protein